jgi:Flp pilus assembly protein TadD
MRHAAAAAVVAALLALSAAAFSRAALWRDPVRLWQDAVAKAPEKSRCWNNLGMAQLSAGRDPEALSAFREAVRLDPVNEIAQQNLTMTAVLCGEKCEPRSQGR